MDNRVLVEEVAAMVEMGVAVAMVALTEAEQAMVEATVATWVAKVVGAMVVGVTGGVVEAVVPTEMVVVVG